MNGQNGRINDCIRHRFDPRQFPPLGGDSAQDRSVLLKRVPTPCLAESSYKDLVACIEKNNPQGISLLLHIRQDPFQVLEKFPLSQGYHKSNSGNLTRRIVTELQKLGKE